MKEREDIDRAEGNVQTLAAQRDELLRVMEGEIERVRAAADPRSEQLQAVTIAPRKKDVAVTAVALAWAPFRRDERGALAPAW